MEFQLWIYYAISIFILAATPGPNILLGITTSISNGFKLSLYTLFGGLSATICIMTLSFTGLGILVVSSTFLFTIIKLSGGIYLIYLGYKVFTSKDEDYNMDKNISITKYDKLSLFRKGFFVGASNPKAIVFFIALFPQFINPNNSLLAQYIIFVTTFAIFELSWLIFYAYLGDKASNWFLQKGRAKFFNRITGSIFIGAGTLISTSSRT